MNRSPIRRDSGPRIGVIGAGLIGLSIAWRLAERGLAVTLFERSEPGSGASFAAAGMLSVAAEADLKDTAFYELCREGRRRWSKFAEELESIAHVDIELSKEGTIVVASTSEQAKLLERLASARSADGTLRMLDQAEMRSLEPGLLESQLSAYWAPEDGSVDNRATVTALMRACTQRAVKFVTGEIRGLTLRAGAVSGVETEHGGEHFDIIVVAAGLGSTALIAESGMDALPELTPVKGELIAVHTPPGAPHLHHVIRSLHGIYLVPRRSGRIIIGATSEEGSWDLNITSGARDWLHKAACTLVPALATYPIVDQWSGLRPKLPSGRPIIGPSRINGLYLAIGHFRSGVLLAPITADLIAGSITQTLSVVDQRLISQFVMAGASPEDGRRETARPTTLP